MTAGDPARPFAALEGLRVIEVAQNLAGPFCARILGDLGADVVKIEPPGGDAARGWGPPFHQEAGTIFAFANTGKRSVVLDLKSRAGGRVLRRLLESADILVDALRPGALARMGFAHEAVAELNPRLIRLQVLAYGETGPLADLPGYEPLMQAHAGIMASTGPEGGPPVRVGTSLVDMGTGMWGALAVLAALRERERTGRGTRISTALFDTAALWSGYHLLGAADAGFVP
ncbi:MAG: CoA transferase, partial [Gemmatimonadota bacterium]